MRNHCPRQKICGILLVLFFLSLSESLGEKSELRGRRNNNNDGDNNNNSNNNNLTRKKKVVVVVKNKKPPIPDLQGRWRENQYSRKGLNDFLYYMGMNWFKRFYVTSTSWENEQTIFQNGNVYRINGYKGPQAEVYSYTVTADNSTVTWISMGDLLGGHMSSVTEVPEAAAGDSLVSYLAGKESGNVEVVVTRTRKKGQDEMVETTKHLASNTILRAVYKKQ